MTPISPTNLSSTKRALLAINALQARLAAADQQQTEAIAIIGLGCRFPHANGVAAFWTLLHEATDAISELPAKRWGFQSYYDPDPAAPGKTYSQNGGFLKDIDQFDASFFNISPREAKSLDPQQRLLLEVSWEALEHANQVPEQLFKTLAGVFVGISTSDYALRTLKEDDATIDAYFGTGNALSMAAGRLSYALGLTGPALIVDTACSSSLVAVHLACQSLRQQECRLALAGGVNLILSPENSISVSKARMLSPEGRCKTFDASANGYVRGEGCGVVVLKRLSDAIADDDRVLAIIRGSAVNQDGPSGGLTVPNGPAQQAVIRQALTRANVEPQQVQYVEAHGTGTSLGDPIELQAIGAVYGKDRPVDHPLIVGSVKTNIGHLEAAAGIAGLIKLVLALQHQKIPAHLHFQQPSPHIPWAELPITIPTQALPWSTGSQPRIAGLSSFGFSGTNAHLILEAAPAPNRSTPDVSKPGFSADRSTHLLTLTAKSETALQHMARDYAAYLAAHPEVDYADVCFTANACRSHFKHRLALVANSRQSLQIQLDQVARAEQTNQGYQGQAGSGAAIAFLFTGQGCQSSGMGQQLYQTQPLFRDTLHHCADILTQWLDIPLLELLYPELYPSTYAPDCLNETCYTQPALFALEYALAQLWQQWGIRPAAVMGHSLGEYVAACIAGVFSLEDGLKLIAHRSRLMQQLPHNGGMAAVLADEATVAAVIAPHAGQVSIAAFNGPKNLVLSGTLAALDRVLQALEAQGLKSQRLAVSHAFHSALMEPMLNAFEAVANEITYAPPQLNLVSNVTGATAGAEIATANYWVQHVRQPVQFARSMTTLLEQGHKVLLEIGAKPTLLGMVRRLGDATTGHVWLGLPSLQPDQEDWQTMLSSLGRLFVQGIEVDWRGVEQPYERSPVLGLPTYPFQRQRYWFNERPPSKSSMQTPQPQNQRPDQDQNRRSSILELLQNHISKSLIGEGASVNPHASFLELGADSINLFETMQMLENTFGLQVSVRQFFEELTTLDALATYIEQSLPSNWNLTNRQRLQPVLEISQSETAPANDTVLQINQLLQWHQQQVRSTDASEAPLVRVIQEQLAVLHSVMSQQLEALRSQPVSLNDAGQPANGALPHRDDSASAAVTNGKSAAIDQRSSQRSERPVSTLDSVSPAPNAFPPQPKALTIRPQPTRATEHPLSLAQQRMWWLETWVETQNVYLIPVAVQIEGVLDFIALEASLNAIIARHESLRTSFHIVDGQPIQRLHSQRSLQLARQQMPSGLPPLAEIQARLSRLSEPLFKLETDLLLRAQVLSWGDRHHVLLLVLHHLVADGWSAGVLIREMLTLYPALVAGRTLTLPPLPIQYGDFALWDRQTAEATLSTRLTYWQQQLAQAPTQLLLPLDAPRPPRPTFRGQTHHHIIEPGLSRSLKTLSQRSGVTLFMLLLGAYSILLSRYSGQTDMMIGSTFARRQQPETQALIGLFLNTLIFRVNLAGAPTVAEFLERVKHVVLDAFAHPEIPFEALSAALPASERRTEWFQTLFILQSTPRPKLALPDFELSLLNVNGDSAKCDLSLWMIETPEGLRAEWEYNCDLFQAETITRMAAQFQHLLHAIVQEPEQSLSQIAILPPSESAQLVQLSQVQPVCIAPLSPVHEWFQTQAQQTPAAIAIEHHDTAWSYRTLNEAANQIAHALHAQGVSTGDRVAVCLERSPHLIATLLGILKVGAAYVPLDPTYPLERLHQMLDDAQVGALMTRPDLQAQLQLNAAIVLSVDDPIVAQQPITNLDVTVALSQVAYIIYTSGSTGKPKGTVLTHQGLANFVQQAIAQYGFSEGDRVLQFASISFDAAVEEIYGTLCSGGTLVLRTQEMLASSATFCQVCTTQRLTVLDLPTAFWHRLTQDLAQGMAQLPEGLRLVIIGGERVLLPIVQLWQHITQHQTVRLLNTYGPTEATVVATMYEITPQTPLVTGTEVPIGRPLGNVQVYVLDDHLQPVPLGVAGELYLGGAGLAEGYLNRPELTAERFLAHPQTADRLYKTGDRVRMLPTGDLVYLGRMDHQVKVRGFRVELGEIEQVLQQHPAVRESAVIAQSDAQGLNQLLAYVVTIGEAATAQDLRQWLQTHLPDYMVPAVVIFVAAIPLTPAGKLDRRSLPQPTAADWVAPSAYLAPRNATEAALTVIVAEVLGLERVGIQDDFFGLGGHSLSAMQVLARIRTLFGKEVSLRSLFETPTVAALATQLESMDAVPSNTDRVSQAIASVDRTQPIALSFAQQRLWFLYQLEGASTTYNLPVALRLTGQVNVAAMKQCLAAIVDRHDALRTTFTQSNEQGMQVIHPHLAVPITVIDMAHLDPTTQATVVKQSMAQAAQHTFDLQTGPLLSVTLLRLQPASHLLLVTMHHIISDAWSIGVLVHEIMALYPAYCQGDVPQIAPLPVQYADYTVWQSQQHQTADFQQRLAAWVQTFVDAPPLLELPTDRPRPALQTFQGGMIRAALPADLTQQLKTFSQQHQKTLFMTLLAGFVTLLHRYSRQTDLVVGTPIAGRNHPDLEKLIGFFINTLPLRFALDDITFTALLEQVQTKALDAFANQDLPFSTLIEQLPLARDLSHLPLCQVMFVLQNAPTEVLQLPNLTLELVPTHSEISRFDLTLSMTEANDRLLGEWEYNSDLFDAASIQRMADQFAVLLRAIVDQPEQPIAHLPLLPIAERQQLLVDWNQTQVELPQRCIHRWIEEQVWQTPNAIAIEQGDVQMSYADLNARSNQLAHYLQSLELQPDQLVGICLNRSIDQVIAMLAVLKAGGAYVPLDPAYPVDRLAHMVNDSQLQVLILQPGLEAKFPDLNATVQCLSLATLVDELDQQSISNPISFIEPHHLAYVIYTSGSTGLPKGVLVEHKGLGNLALAQIQAFAVQRDSHILQMASFSFDASVSEILMTLCAGARLVIASLETLTGGNLVALLQGQSITHLTVPPSLLSVLPVAELASLEHIIVAGEACPAELVAKWSERPGFYNAYGPTEASVCATIANCTATRGKPSIGRPIANVQVYVVDQHLQPVPIGVPGELLLGGVGLARGYLNRPDLTAKRFIPHPFTAQPGDRVYRTGDLVRYRPDGQLDYLGRIDQQVKLRGFRIELGEIEAVLLQHPAVSETIVSLRETGQGSTLLVAYVVPTNLTSSPLVADLQHHVRDRLPNYMVPAAFMLLESLPLSPNGKVDRKALPIPQSADLRQQGQYVAPRNVIETALVEVWSDILGLASVGVTDNFFELGGHSILAMQLLSRIQQRFQVKLPLQPLFEQPTIAQIAEIIAAEQISQTDADLLDRLLAEVEGLSEEILFEESLPEETLPEEPLPEETLPEKNVRLVARLESGDRPGR